MTGFQKAQAESPDRLVEAIATARREGMPDVAAELETTLPGKRLDGERPVLGGALPPDESFLPALPAAKANGKAAKS